MSVIVSKGAEIHYRDSGEGEQVLVWGHGFLVSSRCYADVIGRLPGHRSIAVDFRGHGRSAAAAEDATLAQIADDIAAILRQIGVRSIVYIGHSTGNAVGMRLAAKYPGLVRAGVSLAGVPVGGMPPQCRALTAGLLSMQGDPLGFAAAFGQMMAHEGQAALAKAAGEEAALVPMGPLKSIAETELYLDQADTLLPALTQPWLFVIPGNDVVIPPEAQLAGARRVPGARALWMNGEGHLVPQERPAEIAAVIGGFLDHLRA